MLVGDIGLDEIQEAREGVTKLGEEMEDKVTGGRIGIGVRVTSVMGSTGSEVTIGRQGLEDGGEYRKEYFGCEAREVCVKVV